MHNPNGLHVIICGGRNYSLTARDRQLLDLLMIEHVRVGDATGADAGALAWAHHNAIPYRIYYADWQRYGRSAGPMRNAEMLDDLVRDECLPSSLAVVALPGGRGTLSMINKAKARGIRVIEPIVLATREETGHAE